MACANFAKTFQDNMSALGLLAPTTLFGSLQTAVGNLTLILGAFKALGPTATVAEIAGATTTLEKLGAVGAMSASYYIGAVIGVL